MCNHQWQPLTGTGMMQCYLCGLAIPDLHQQSQIQKRMVAEARLEAERELRDRVQREARLLADEEVRRAAGVDRVQPLQFRTPLPPGDALAYSYRGGTTSLVVAKSINPHTYFMHFPQGAWLPGHYQLVVWCDPVIPFKRLEWYCRHKAVSYFDGQHELEAQRSLPYGEWVRLSGMEVHNSRVCWITAEFGKPGDYEIGVTSDRHDGRDCEPTWLDRRSYSLWYPPGYVHEAGEVDPVGSGSPRIGVVEDGPPPESPGPSRFVAQSGGSDFPSEMQPQEMLPDAGIKAIWVALAIFFCVPVGFYLLKRHVVLKQNKKWWYIGTAWFFLGGWMLAAYTGLALIVFLPVVLPIIFFASSYLGWRHPALALDKLPDGDFKGRLKRLERKVALRAESMRSSRGEQTSLSGLWKGLREGRGKR